MKSLIIHEPYFVGRDDKGRLSQFPRSLVACGSQPRDFFNYFH